MAGTATVTEPEELEADGDLIVDQDAILSELAEHDPESVTQTGTVISITQGAQVQKTDPSEMSASFCIVTRMKTPNRNGNLNQIAPSDKGKGLLIDNYQQNPVVLFDHYGVPIGKSETPDGKFTVKLTKQKALAVVYFSQTSAFAAEIFGLVDEKILRAASIGFNPTKAQRINYKSPDLADGIMDLAPGGPNSWGGFDFVESDLTEWSVVGVGADPSALRQCLSRGMIGQEKISTPQMKFWLGQNAEKRPAIGKGFDAAQLAANAQQIQKPAEPTIIVPELVTVEFQGMKLSGASDTVAAMIQKLKPMGVVQQAAPEKPAETVDKNANLNANAPAPVVQTVDQTAQFLKALSGVVASEIQKGLAPCLQSQQEVAQRLQLLTGTQP